MGGADLGGGLLTLQPGTKMAQTEWEKLSTALSASFSYHGIA